MVKNICNIMCPPTVAHNVSGLLLETSDSTTVVLREALVCSRRWFEGGGGSCTRAFPWRTVALLVSVANHTQSFRPFKGVPLTDGWLGSSETAPNSSCPVASRCQRRFRSRDRRPARRASRADRGTGQATLRLGSPRVASALAAGEVHGPEPVRRTVTASGSFQPRPGPWHGHAGACKRS